MANSMFIAQNGSPILVTLQNGHFIPTYAHRFPNILFVANSIGALFKE